MIFGDIPDKALKTVLGETYDGTYSLEDELRQLGEDIVSTNYFQLKDPEASGGLDALTVYTTNYVGILIHGLFGDLCLISVKRNP